MTEEEAKTKWCPFARITPTGVQTVGNMGADTKTGTYIPLGQCIASRCMAWRWSLQTIEERRSSGFCGLAGDPCGTRDGSYAR